jgi:hypothetical protein
LFLNWTINRLVGLLVAISFLAALGTAYAQNATWILNPGSSVWNTATNWTPQTVPTGTASFGSSSTTSITFFNPALIGTIQFNAGAPAYSFDITGETLGLIGAGIVNNSSNAPTFFTAGGGAEFLNTSTAGNATIINNAGTIFFFNTSTAGIATITTNNGGTTNFDNFSAAANATITTNNGGITNFTNFSAAGNATITNNGGITTFQNLATAGHATITTNNGGFHAVLHREHSRQRNDHHQQRRAPAVL